MSQRARVILVAAFALFGVPVVPGQVGQKQLEGAVARVWSAAGPPG